MRGNPADSDFYRMNVDGSNVVQLTALPGYGHSPTWSPDGSRLVFVSNRSGSLDLYVMNVGGANVQQVTSSPERETLPSWSPDGETILYVIFQED